MSQLVVYLYTNVFDVFFLFYLYIYPPDLHENNKDANT